MLLSYMLRVVLLAVSLPTVLACNKAQGCCWGGAATGYDGCSHQHPGDMGKCNTDAYKQDWCSETYKKIKVVKECKADCCNIKTGAGMACPDKGGFHFPNIFKMLFGGFGLGGGGGSGGGGGGLGGGDGGNGSSNPLGGLGSIFGGGEAGGTVGLPIPPPGGKGH